MIMFTNHNINNIIEHNNNNNDNENDKNNNDNNSNGNNYDNNNNNDKSWRPSNILKERFSALSLALQLQ